MLLSRMRILLVDNFDSFTHNLAHLLICAGAEVIVRRNDAVDAAWIPASGVQALCISPGPGGPADSGCSPLLVRRFAGAMPILGVCLGMQVINEVFGGMTIHAPEPVHGRADAVIHDGSRLFTGLPSPFGAARYHSLSIETRGGSLRITASTPDGVPMALEHTAMPVWGVQFHPESFMTPNGREIAENFLALCAEHSRV